MKRYLEVTGQGSATQRADQVVISLSLIAKQPDYAATLAQSANQLTELQQSLEALGFDKEIIQTRNYRLNTSYEPDPSSPIYRTVFDGYRLVHDLMMSFDHDDEALNQLLDKLSKLSDKPEFHLSFRIKDPSAVEELALERAVADANHQAKELARLNGVRLGMIQTIMPTQTGGPSLRLAEKQAAFDMEFPAGETAITRAVTIRFAIE